MEQAVGMEIRWPSVIHLLGFGGIFPQAVQEETAVTPIPAVVIGVAGHKTQRLQLEPDAPMENTTFPVSKDSFLKATLLLNHLTNDIGLFIT